MNFRFAMRRSRVRSPSAPPKSRNYEQGPTKNRAFFVSECPRLYRFRTPLAAPVFVPEHPVACNTDSCVRFLQGRLRQLPRMCSKRMRGGALSRVWMCMPVACPASRTCKRMLSMQLLTIDQIAERLGFSPVTIAKPGSGCSFGKVQPDPDFRTRIFAASPDRARQAHAERFHRELQRQVPRRVPQRTVVHDVAASARRDQRLAT